VRGAGEWKVLALEPEKHQLAMAAVRKGVQDISQPGLVVSGPILRPHVRRLIDGELAEIPVLAKAELLDEFRIDPSRVIELEPRNNGRI
jgi:type III secretory pathway component EscV